MTKIQNDIMELVNGIEVEKKDLKKEKEIVALKLKNIAVSIEEEDEEGAEYMKETWKEWLVDIISDLDKI